MQESFITIHKSEIHLCFILSNISLIQSTDNVLISKPHQLDNYRRHFSICDSEHILERTELRVGYITGLVSRLVC